MKFGVDYYPEQWPKSRWELDARQMAEAHINIVRLGEFAWSKLEPYEGAYDFVWLDEVISILEHENIKVILGTPTAAPPKWLMDQYPECYPENAFGIRRGFGARRHYCYSNPKYRELSVKIAEAMALHYSHNKNVAGWQVDNEMGGACYCSSCQKGFQVWLQKKYNYVGELNEAWGTNFWSQTYHSFEQVETPRYTACDEFTEAFPATGRAPGVIWSHNPGLLLDYARYSSDAKIDYLELQVDAIRKKTILPITHNFMGNYADINYYKLGERLSVVSWDNYIDTEWGTEKYYDVALAHDIIRGIKNKNFWVMEQQSGPCGWQNLGNTPEPGQLRLWTYQAIAHGAEAILYFRWRAALFGTEQNWYGILNHDGTLGRRYREIQEIGAQLKKLGTHLENLENPSEILIIRDFDNLWCHRGQPQNVKFNYDKLIRDYYEALFHLHLNVDISSIDCDWSSYKLVIMPAFTMTTDEIADKCNAYVKAGGILLLTFQAGRKEWSNQMSDQRFPSRFADLAGIMIDEFDSLNGGRNIQFQGNFGEGTASIWCESLEPTTASVLARYQNGYYQGMPAVTRNAYGKGFSYYVGCDMDQEPLKGLLKQIVSDCMIQRDITTVCEGLETVIRKHESGKYLYVLNHTSEERKLKIEGAYFELIEEHEEEGIVILPPYGVKILKTLKGAKE